MSTVHENAAQAAARAVHAILPGTVDASEAQPIAAVAIDAYLEARRPAGPVVLPPGAATLVDRLGAAPIRLTPSAELGLLLDLGGRLNKSDQAVEVRYLLTAGVAAELVAALVIAAKELGLEAALFDHELEAAIGRLKAA